MLVLMENVKHVQTIVQLAKILNLHANHALTLIIYLEVNAFLIVQMALLALMAFAKSAHHHAKSVKIHKAHAHLVFKIIIYSMVNAIRHALMDL